MNPVIIALNRQIIEAQEAVAAFQNDCSHPENQVIKREFNNVDDYDRPGTGDLYWINYHCEECNKRWATERKGPYGPERRLY